MKQHTFLEAVARACVLYAVGSDEYDRHMDMLGQQASGAQWEAVLQILDLTDEWMVDADQATVYQREKVAARRAGRPSRYPGALSQGTPEADAAIAALEQEYSRKEQQ